MSFAFSRSRPFERVHLSHRLLGETPHMAVWCTRWPMVDAIGPASIPRAHHVVVRGGPFRRIKHGVVDRDVTRSRDL